MFDSMAYLKKWHQGIYTPLVPESLHTAALGAVRVVSSRVLMNGELERQMFAIGEECPYVLQNVVPGQSRTLEGTTLTHFLVQV
ncbi:hypothetical protein AVEN_164739-1 [Araneus ventricosus]|uniref:Uncharacterized protein n=1 Tax=Araneus ventricosus TaxID=182803 RepID=A0A4Y2HJZ3_ARAVE|nr:hypothetical protein AVEN_164739-1 [Araneus ventricosus]